MEKTLKWCVLETNWAVRASKHNIIMQLPGLKFPAKIGPKAGARR